MDRLLVKFSMFVLMTNTNKHIPVFLGMSLSSDDSKLSPANQCYLAHSNNEIANFGCLNRRPFGV
uniref:hypothetical protein n=1 Tax=Vibrio navarrensis TaxID=29495 RepID=UPI0030DB1AD5